MTLRLRAWTEDGPSKEPGVVVDRTISIGRGEPDLDINVDDTYVSKLHARLSPVPDCATPTLLFEDMGSTNGIYVNDTKVYLRKVQAGDLIRCGRTTWIVEEVR